jgi:hypothetical protein
VLAADLVRESALSLPRNVAMAGSLIENNLSILVS